MASHREWFLNNKDIGGGKVILGDNHECNIKGIGDIQLRMHDVLVKTLKYVRHVSQSRWTTADLLLIRCELEESLGTVRKRKEKDEEENERERE